MTTNDDYKRAEAKAERARRRAMAAILALTVAYFAFLGYLHATQPTRERAAYLEGRYGLAHDDALALARQGHGLTAQDVVEGRE